MKTDPETRWPEPRWPEPRWMDAALALARRGVGATAPNPSVGCVITRGGVVLGRGVTAAGGRPHAETQALLQAGAAARGADVYVTLEPCAHHGQTPPCCDALIKAGVARVCVAIEDTDPRTAGRGAAALRAAGIVVHLGLGAAEAADINAGFLRRAETGLPFVTLKMAATLDGRIATGGGESRWITGAAARARTHLLRARHDAVMIGVGTALADDPMLDVRLAGLETRRPARVVADSRLQTPLTSRLARTAAAHPLILLHRPDANGDRRRAFADLGAQLCEVPVGETGSLDLHDALLALGRLGLSRVLCEGGGHLAAALLRADLIDEIQWMTAGAAIGAEGVPAIGGLGLAHLDAAPRYRLLRADKAGADVVSIWRRDAE